MSVTDQEDVHSVAGMEKPAMLQVMELVEERRYAVQYVLAVEDARTVEATEKKHVLVAQEVELYTHPQPMEAGTIITTMIPLTTSPRQTKV
ncbi:MAG: hypothetical protein IJR85_06990 [Synergistaceae bacterium]|nr:hypothetical protein [Synergistaceae bacterium]